ncbi:hypothetical protein [Actinacidiphila acididurans]|uniref:Uncharacterized protein n=1 Tax=Actinacidiphila acididurans TaxID=2784346 RepID=A0ABS2U2U9_9ACTN|nr:hypothetical protein [Actinacidiphila acididurans]MBM9509924.1 hypothetical protein [Actinacidiphila acididurans]
MIHPAASVPAAVTAIGPARGSGLSAQVPFSLPFGQNGDGLRARDVCRTLGTGTEPRQTEGMRAKPNRLANRGILTESGLFTLTKRPPATPEANSS